MVYEYGGGRGLRQLPMPYLRKLRAALVRYVDILVSPGKSSSPLPQPPFRYLGDWETGRLFATLLLWILGSLKEQNSSKQNTQHKIGVGLKKI